MQKTRNILIILVILIGFGVSAKAQVIINQDNSKPTEELENKGCGYSVETAQSNFVGGLIAGWKYSNSCKFKNYKVKITYKEYKANDRGGHTTTDFNSIPVIKTKIVYLKPNTKDEIIYMYHCEFVDEECLNCD